jgi:hypothetical protein
LGAERALQPGIGVAALQQQQRATTNSYAATVVNVQYIVVDSIVNSSSKLRTLYNSREGRLASVWALVRP